MCFTHGFDHIFTILWRQRRRVIFVFFFWPSWGGIKMKVFFPLQCFAVFQIAKLYVFVFTHGIHLRKINGWNLKMMVWFRWFSFLNGWYLGSMLTFRGVPERTKYSYLVSFKLTFFKHCFPILPIPWEGFLVESAPLSCSWRPSYCNFVQIKHNYNIAMGKLFHRVVVSNIFQLAGSTTR